MATMFERLTARCEAAMGAPTRTWRDKDDAYRQGAIGAVDLKGGGSAPVGPDAAAIVRAVLAELRDSGDPALRAAVDAILAQAPSEG